MDLNVLASELIRALRGPRSQTAFSRRLGYRSNVVYTWEAGIRAPTASETLRAAARVGVEPDAA
jgi:DNA-binding transcriptional regulator YiaG